MLQLLFLQIIEKAKESSQEDADPKAELKAKLAEVSASLLKANQARDVPRIKALMTTQKTELGMHQNPHFQLNPLKINKIRLSQLLRRLFPYGSDDGNFGTFLGGKTGSACTNREEDVAASPFLVDPMWHVITDSVYPYG